ncbi:DUF4065 domain-containing protein [Rickettsiales bacterium]|nr:DUF4065 domain-containing protein [Rickettsiales bacterium]
MELLKLSYIAHGFSLALRDKPLLNCNIEAWPLGPVVANMYYDYRKQGSRNIETIESESSTLDDQEEEIIEVVIEKYKDKTAYELSDLTHDEGTP